MSEHDNAIPPECERFMAERMNAVTESVDGSHVAFISQPDVASGLILKALASAVSATRAPSSCIRCESLSHHGGVAAMPMIDVYAAAGTFSDTQEARLRPGRGP